MKISSVAERDQKTSIGNRLHLREKPFRVERSGGPSTTPAKPRKGRLADFLALSSSIRTTRPRETPDSRATRFSHSERSSGSRTVSVLLICSRSEEHTSELQSQSNLVCRLL